MKRILFLLFCFAMPAFAQNLRVDGVAFSRSGLPAPGALVAICTQPANTSTTPCSALAPLCTSVASACVGGQGGGGDAPNPTQADGLGNYNFYLKGTVPIYTLQIYGSGLTPRVQPDQIATGSGSAVIPTCATFQGVLCLDSVNSGGVPGADAGAQLNNLYAGAPSFGCRIHVVAGTYNFATPINLGTNQKPCILEGDPAGATVLNYTATSGVAITLHWGASHQYGAGIRDITLQGPCATTACVAVTSVGINPIDEGDYFLNFRVGTVGQGFAKGVQYSSSFGFIDHWVNAQIYYNAVGLAQPAGKTNENVSFEGGSISANAVAVELTGGGDWYWHNTSFDDNTAACAILFDGVTGITGSFDEDHFENPSGGPACYVNMTAPGFLYVMGGNTNDARAVGTNTGFFVVNGAKYASLSPVVFSNGISVTQVLNITGSLGGCFITLPTTDRTRVLSDFTSSYTGPCTDLSLNLSTPNLSQYLFGAGTAIFKGTPPAAGSIGLGCNASEATAGSGYVGWAVSPGTCTPYLSNLPLAAQTDTTNTYPLLFKRDASGNMGASWGGSLTVDATLTQFITGAADPCVAISNTLTAFTLYGTVVDARGFGTPFGPLASTWPNIPCSVAPIPTGAQSILYLPAGIFKLQAMWTIPNRFQVIGQGWDQNPAVGIGATTLKACKADTACGGVTFPAAPGGPLVGWQDRLGGPGNGGSSPDFDAQLIRANVDCNGALGAIGVQAMNPEENGGLREVKIANCGNHGRWLQIGGSDYPQTGAGNQVTATNGSTTVTNSGGASFLPDMVNNQVKFSGDTNCAGAPCNYIITAVNAAQTQLTISPAYVAGGGPSPNNTAQVLQNNSATQNADFYNLYLVNSNTSTTTTDSVEILAVTGSASNELPKGIRLVTAVNSNATLLDFPIRISGYVLQLDEIHIEACGISCVLIGADNNTTMVSYTNSQVGSINPAGTTNQVQISNAFTTTNYTIQNISNVAPNNPTNTLLDQSCSNTIPSASERTLALYVVGFNCLTSTTSGVVFNKMFGLSVGNGSAGTPSLNFGDATTGLFRPSSNTVGVSLSGTENFRFLSTGLKFASGNALQFTSGAIAGASDLAVARAGAQIAQLSDGGANANGYLKNLGTVRVVNDVTFSADTALHAITGLSWAIPSTIVAAFRYKCDLIYSQATGAAADAFGIQVVTTAPTNVVGIGDVQITVGPPSTYVSGTVSFASTTATNVVAFTPGATATNYVAHISGTLVNPVTTPNTFQIMALTGNTSDTLTVRAGSSCDMWVSSN